MNSQLSPDTRFPSMYLASGLIIIIIITAVNVNVRILNCSDPLVNYDSESDIE